MWWLHDILIVVNNATSLKELHKMRELRFLTLIINHIGAQPLCKLIKTLPKIRIIRLNVISISLTDFEKT